MSNVPLGPTSEIITSGSEYLNSRVEGTFMKRGVLIASTARYNGGTTLPKGLALAKITASGKYAEYDDGNSDGTEEFRGFLDQDIDLLDATGVARDAQASMVFWGWVNTANTFGEDAAAKTDAADGQNECFFIWG